jgi:hypothetical protein
MNKAGVIVSYKCKKEMHDVCSNNALCHLCDGISLFNDPVANRKEKMVQREANKEAEKNSILKNYKAEKKEGMAFEKKVAAAWNNKFSSNKPKKKVAKPRFDVDAIMNDTQEEDDHEEGMEKPSFLGYRPPDVKAKPKFVRPEAQRQANSGAMWHSKGDIKLEHALLECKERGTKNARGEKQITIPKLWIEKQEQEAFQEQRPYWYIPFGYKGDDGIYLVKSFDHEMEMIYEMRNLREENEKLKAQLGDTKND